MSNKHVAELTEEELEKRRAYHREWTRANRDHVNCSHRERYYAKHEEKLAYDRKRREANRERFRQNARNHYHQHREEILVAGKEERDRVRLEVLAYYGGKCACCGEATSEFLAIDHINGNGTKHRKTIPGGGGGISMYRWLRKNNYPAEFQVLCHNRNMAKGFYGKCPHAKQEAKLTK